MATTLATFKSFIAPDVLPCPDPIVERELVECIQEFCTKTQILTKEFNVDISSEAIDTDVMDSIDLTLSNSIGSNYRPVTIVRFNLDGIEYVPQYREIVNTIEEWETIKEEGVMYFYLVDSDTLRIYDRDSTDENLFIKLAVKPIKTVTSIDDILYYDWLDTIVAGTKYRILKMAGKEWANPKVAALENVTWRRGLSSAKLKVMKGFSNTSVSMNNQSFLIIG